MNSSSIQSTDIFIPDYIWLDIFKYVSPLKLAVLRWTSKPFKNIIEEMIENNYTWKNLCSTNSIKPWIWKIQEKLFSYVKKYSPKELMDKNWKDVLHSYGYWRVYSKRSFKFITFNLRDNLVNYNHITCSDAFGDYFAIASDRGDIFLFTIENDRIYLLHTFAGNQYEIYRQLKFWNAEGNMFLVVTISNSGYLKLFNIDSKKIHKIDSFIRASIFSLTLCRGTDQKLMIGAGNNVIYQLSWNETRKTVNFKPSINIGDAYRHLFWPVKSFCSQYEKTTIAIKYASESKIIFDNGNSKITEIMDPNFDLPPGKIYIPIPEVVIINEGHDLFVVVLNDSNQVRVKRHYLLELIKSKIVSVVMHVNILFLGTSSGNVYLFVIKNIQQLVNENLNQSPVKKIIPISNEPILSLDITEVKKKPYIIAFTKSNLHVIK